MSSHLNKIQLLWLLSVIGPPQAYAETDESWRLILHTRSWHHSHPAQERWNERNWGLGVRKNESADWAWQVGAYRDSLKKNSTYVLADWRPLRFGRVNLGVAAGLITGGGYEAKFKPAAGLVVSYQLERLSATVRVFPKPPPGNNPELHRSALMALEFGWRL